MSRLFYKHIVSVVIVSLSLLGIVGCDGPKVIPDRDLVNIFHDAYVANAYIVEGKIASDSLYIYEPIFNKYGYTMDDLQHTIKTFTERKSAMLSTIMSEVNRRLDEESRAESRKIVVLDTIDNIAKRAYTRTIYSDSLIQVKRLKDTTKLHITIEDLVPAEYAISFTYLIDTLDENRNSRVEAYILTTDSIQTMRNTMMLTRYREAKYTRKLTTDTSHRKIFINMFYHPSNEESKLPDITIRDFKVVRILPTDISVDSLYHDQLNISIINRELMTSFTADTIEFATHDIIDSIAHDEKDSLTLHTL